MLDETAFRHASLCVVGNINRDIKAGGVPPGEGLLGDGETSIPALTETIGGGGANSAFTAAALGARVAFLGKIGADALGGRLERTLQRHGIDAHLARDPAHPTGTSIALGFSNGQRHFLSCLPTSRELAFNDLDLNALAGHQHLLRADIWFSEPMLKGGNQRLFEAAGQMGLDVSIDLNWDPHWGHAPAEEIQHRKKSIRDTLPLVHLVHGNVRELREFTEVENLDQALRRLIEWGARAVVVHLGEKGAGYYENGVLTVEPPVTTKSIVNTTGTGDILSVGLMLLHRQNQIPIPARLALANSIVAQFMEGRREFLPPLEE